MPPIEIEGAYVAHRLGLDVAAFHQLMARRKIAVLCERGTGEDAGGIGFGFQSSRA